MRAAAAAAAAAATAPLWCNDRRPVLTRLSVPVALQNQKAFQKQDCIFVGKKRVIGKAKKSGLRDTRYYKSVGLGIKTPRTAIEGTYVDKKCPWTGARLRLEPPPAQQVAVRRRRGRSSSQAAARSRGSGGACGGGACGVGASAVGCGRASA